MADNKRSIVLQGNVKVLGEQYIASWSDTVLTLFSDASLEYQVDKATKLVKVGPTTTTTRSRRANYPEVFVVNTVPESDYSSGPMFSAADAKGADEWINKINLTRMLQAARNAAHPHPLTRATNSVQYTGGLQATSIHITEAIKCKLCSNKAWQGYTCEFCHNYRICETCETSVRELSRKMVKSPTHEHALIRFERANDPICFNENYNGNYNCDQCKTDQSGEVYHCITCQVYDECPACAKGIKKPILVAQTLGNLSGDAITGNSTKKAEKSTVEVSQSTSNNPTQLEVKHLASVMNVDGNSFSLQLTKDAKVPIGCSMISNRRWNLSKIETQPVPNAYMEVTFTKFAPNSFVGVGIGNQIWVQNQMLGLQQNSYGYFNNGTVSHNIVTQEPSYFPGFEAGDTIGVGILYDSYNTRRLFFTKNGQMLGNFPAAIHKGMDCFPGVSFKSDSEVSFTVELNGPLKFDVRSIPDTRSDKTDRMKSVPTEILAVILSYTVTSPALALELRLVNKNFSQVACDNLIWKRLFLAKWPMQNTKLKLKSWYTLYKRRSGVKPSAAVPKGSSKNFIENCDFEFQCPLLWEKMKTGNNENERFCDKCQKTVYSVSDETTLYKYAEMGRCVSLVPKPKLSPVGPPVMHRLGGAPRPRPRDIPPPK